MMYTLPQDMEVKIQFQVNFSSHQCFLKLMKLPIRMLGAGCWNFSSCRWWREVKLHLSGPGYGCRRPPQLQDFSFILW